MRVRHRMMVFLHPSGLTHGERRREHYLNDVIGNPFGSTIAVSHLIFKRNPPSPSQTHGALRIFGELVVRASPEHDDLLTVPLPDTSGPPVVQVAEAALILGCEAFGHRNDFTDLDTGEVGIWSLVS